MENNILTKIIISLILITIQLSANENWIPIKPIEDQPYSKQNIKLNVNLSQVEPINKMMKNATAIKQLIDATSKKEKAVTNDKNWFVIKEEKQ